MKSNTFFLMVILMFSWLVVSCEKQAELVKGQFEVAIALANDAQLLKSQGIDSSNTGIDYGYYLLITVQKSNGETVINDQLMPLLSFGNGFLSPRIELDEGEYFISKLMVVNKEGDVRMAAPMKGSEMAYLVDEPLPIKFLIKSSEVLRVTPEVLDVTNDNGHAFGYAVLGIHIVKPLVAYIGVYIDNPMIMAPTALTSAKLNVTASNGWHYSFWLEPRINRILLREVQGVYKIQVLKDGFDEVTYHFSAMQLKQATAENPLMLAIGGLPQQKLVLQPDSVLGKDATIVDLRPDVNMGNYKYLEASWVSEPILTVMRTTRSLLFFSGISQLPESAIIKKVTLTLAIDWKNWMTDNSLYHNEMNWPKAVLRQIVEPWDESNVTWANQPKTIEANEVYIDINPALSTIFRTIDVTSLFVPFQEVAAPNYGMMLMLIPNEALGIIQFASSDFPVSSMRPQLTVYYTTSQ